MLSWSCLLDIHIDIKQLAIYIYTDTNLRIIGDDLLALPHLLTKYVSFPSLLSFTSTSMDNLGHSHDLNIPLTQMAFIDTGRKWTKQDVKTVS